MKKIIIVDDDPGLQDAFSIVFSPDAFEVTILANADALLCDEFEIPDLFILDKQLSGVDGLDVCRYLKSKAETKNIPVIMLSASPHIGRLARLAGAEDALEKPFKLKEFRAMVARYIH